MKKSKDEKLNRAKTLLDLDIKLNKTRLMIESNREILDKLVMEALENGTSISDDKQILDYNRTMSMLIVEYNKLKESEHSILKSKKLT